ncbi:hypothetical protein PVAND_010876 [Polypedilum vanderplanki]|uniref:Uncharacterized protein n=1 Tax=Polypedilum vanderplanki TaxID=319348 RepID=A0A9J6CHV0_POLVA|nr:hypothetical protein PVAND_010876 [Polypedilum vanderplanki]
MNDFHRSKIDKNIENLVNMTDYDLMKEELLRKEVFTEVMFKNIESDPQIDNEQKRLFATYTKLRHRGPTAFQKLLEILKENGYDEAYKIMNSPTLNAAQTYPSAIKDDDNCLSIKDTKEFLRQNSSISPNSESNNSEINKINNNHHQVEMTDGVSPSKINSIKRTKPKLEPYFKKTAFKHKNLEVKRAEDFGSHPKIPVYSMRSARRGVLFFVNIIKFQDEKTNRRGAENDRENLVTLFREMNFTVFYYEDLTRGELFELLNQLIKSEYLHRIDSFFLCIQTHGDLYNNQTVMEFSDGSREYTETIISIFSNVGCPQLIKKPKVFFFPFCRGKISDKIKNIEIPVIETDGRAYRIQAPTFSDQLICYGTVPGFMTHRDTSYGSWYIYELCKVFAENACDCHIEEMLKLVGENTYGYKDTEGRTQITSTESRGFYNLLYLNPKIQE